MVKIIITHGYFRLGYIIFDTVLTRSTFGLRPFPFIRGQARSFPGKVLIFLFLYIKILIINNIRIKNSPFDCVCACACVRQYFTAIFRNNNRCIFEKFGLQNDRARTHTRTGAGHHINKNIF